MARRFKKVSEKTVALREKHWPELTEDELWNRKEFDGFTSIPRTIPLILNIIDDLTKGQPAGSTYLALWCKAFDEMYINLQNPEDMAYQSGFSGQRALRSWQLRMTALADLGFIKLAKGPRGSLSHAAIPNPHFVIRRLHAKKQPGLTDAAFESLLERASDIGAEDMTTMPLPEDRPPPAPATAPPVVVPVPVPAPEK